MTRRVLFIAPVAPQLPRLAWFDELAAIGRIRGADVTFVAGQQATLDTVSDALAQLWDDVVYSGHGTANRLILSDGEEINGDWFATQARAAAPECIVVGACFSDDRDAALNSIGETIAQAGMHAITFAAAVNDRAGAVFSREYVRSMVAVPDPSKACKVASQMCARVSQVTAESVRFHAGVMNGYSQFKRSILTIEDTVRQLDGKVDDLLARVSALEQKAC